MKSSSRKLSVYLVGGLAAGSLLLAGCSSNSATSTASSAASAAASAAESAGGAASAAASEAASALESGASAAESGASAAASGADSAAFCATALSWAQSPAKAKLQTAQTAQDQAGMVAALKEWSAETQAFAASVPASAPESVKTAFTDFTQGIVTAGETGTLSQEQAAALAAAQTPITDYVKQTCQ